MKKFKKEKYIIQRKRGNNWQFLVQIRANDQVYSKSFQSSKYFDASSAYNAAVEYRDDILYKSRKGLLTKEADITVEQCLIRSFSVIGIRQRTQQANLLMLNKYMSSYKNQSVQSITPADVMECLSEAAKIASQDTLKRIMTAWHRVAKTAYLSDWISRDFTFALQIPQSQIIVSHKTAYTSLETLNDVCKKLTEYGSHSGGNRYDNQIIIYALKLMYYLGLRPSETFALSREDIDMKKGELSINKELGSSTSEKWTIRPCKNNTSIRTLPIPAELQPILKELLDYSKTDNIFADHKGKYMKTWLVSSKLNRISKDLKIDFRMYQLRHQFSTDLIVGGADLRTVQELMGHADSSMTLSYARSNSSKKKSVVDDRKESKME